jgi:Chondroitinase B
MASVRCLFHALLSLSTVLLCLAATSATAGTTAGTAGGGDIPAPSRTTYVSSSSQLSKAINNAVAGDHIVLTNGTYSGFTVSRSGQSGKPIVIRAGNLHAAKFSGNIIIDGSYVWVIGMDMRSHGISISGAYDRVSGNLFKSSTVNAIYAGKTSRNAEIDHNEHAGGIITRDNLDPIGLRYSCSLRPNHYVHHNYLHDGIGTNSDALASGWGTVCSGLSPEGGSLFEHNFVENWYAGSCISVKSSGNTFRFNTCLGNKDVAQEAKDLVGAHAYQGVRNRVGRQNQYIANWLEGVNQLRIYDAGNTVIGNKVIRSSIWISSGNMAVGDPREEGYIAATDTLVVLNDGRLEIGRNFSCCNSKPAKATRVEAHITGNRCKQGSIVCGNHTGTTFSATATHTSPTAFKLSASQVGPFAPTAPKLRQNIARNQ